MLSLFPFYLHHRSPHIPLPSGHAPAAAPDGPLRRARRQLARRLRRRALLVADGLVDAQDQAAGLGGGLQGVDLDQGGLPHEALQHVGGALVLEVDAGPGVALAVLDAQLVEDVGGVEAGVVAQLARDNLQRLGKRLDDGLLLVRDVLVGVVVQVRRDLHLDGAAAADNRPVLDGALDNHDGVVQRALHLGNELLGAAAQHQRARLGLGAALEEVVALAANLALLKGLARAQVLRQDVGACGLGDGAGGLGDALHVLGRHAAGAEDVAVGKVLRGQVANGQLAEHHLGARLGDGLELLVDDLPLGVHNGLVFGHLLDADLGVVLFGLELQLDIQAHNLGLAEGLGLLLEAGIGECLLEGHAVDEAGLGQGTAGDLLDADELLVEVVLVE